MGASGNLGAKTTAILKNNHAAQQSNVTYKNTLIQTAIFIVFIIDMISVYLASMQLFCGTRKPLLETMKLLRMFVNPSAGLRVYPPTRAQGFPIDKLGVYPST